jgi:hypothetical protein
VLSSGNKPGKRSTAVYKTFSGREIMFLQYSFFLDHHFVSTAAGSLWLLLSEPKDLSTSIIDLVVSGSS